MVQICMQTTLLVLYSVLLHLDLQDFKHNFSVKCTNAIFRSTYCNPSRPMSVGAATVHTPKSESIIVHDLPKNLNAVNIFHIFSQIIPFMMMLVPKSECYSKPYF